MSSDNSSIRLNKFIALHAGISRREADELIKRGGVMVNGERAALGSRALPSDIITVKGEPLATETTMQYLMMHKPVNYVCSRRQQGDSPTIYELLPQQYQKLKTVGRLDRDSSGLILLTNDGDFAQEMTHPRYVKTKRYEVTLDRQLEPLHQQMISDFGVDLDDGKSQLSLEKVTDDRLNWIVTMHEGRNRQIRRTFEALGYAVTKLHRTNFGNYNIGDLAKGKFEKIAKL